MVSTREAYLIDRGQTLGPQVFKKINKREMRNEHETSKVKEVDANDLLQCLNVLNSKNIYKGKYLRDAYSISHKF